MKILTLGEFTVHPEYKVPSIEVLLDGVVKGHLTPFRGYHFQVSKTYDGHTDLGISINGYTLTNHVRSISSDRMLRDIFKAFAISALVNYTKVYTCHYRDIEKENDIVVDITTRVLIGKQDNFDDFITASVKWVKSIA